MLLFPVGPSYLCTGIPGFQAVWGFPVFPKRGRGGFRAITMAGGPLEDSRRIFGIIIQVFRPEGRNDPSFFMLAALAFFPILRGVRNPGEAEHGDVGGCRKKHPPPAPPEFPGIPRFSQQELRVGRGLGLAALAHALVSEQPVRAGEALHAALALVRLLPAVHALVPLQVVLLDEAHVAHVTLERLLPGVDEDVPFEVVAAPEGAETVVADEVLELEGAVLLNHHHLFHGFLGVGGLRSIIVLAGTGLVGVLAEGQEVRAGAPFPVPVRFPAGFGHHLLAGDGGDEADAREPLAGQETRLSHAVGAFGLTSRPGKARLG